MARMADCDRTAYQAREAKAEGSRKPPASIVAGLRSETLEFNTPPAASHSKRMIQVPFRFDLYFRQRLLEQFRPQRSQLSPQIVLKEALAL